MSHPRYVYVVEQGCYSSAGVVGVYISPEAAMAAHPIPANFKYPDTPTVTNGSRRGGWRPDPHAEPGYAWDNGLDWDDATRITRYEVEGEILKENAVVPPAGDPSA